ncbi:hypothetical protein [Schinkia azotoformans]|uniref:hypothetical protein n=1 Tax=Schinkia azotoformans TaxID=1454 RepID=UPI002DBE5590|nr:hypothetical protein [Schinkia azotoformans]MEC1786070.1 hypothetical protein [Schinkia azotoformans]MED4420106.1 hypothetical protein [Schinkia azotoformans]
MRLFKCWNSDITVNHDIMIMWAKDEQAALNKIVEARSKDECFRDWLLYDSCLDEVINDLQGNCEVFEHLADGNLDGFAEEVYKAIDLKLWTIEEYFVDRCSVVFACYESFLDDEDSCQVVTVPENVFDYKDYIYGVLAERLAEEEHFRQYISDPAVNMTFCESFWHDEKGYVFEEFELDIREDIYRKFNWDIPKANNYIEKCFVNNVKDFFKEPQYADIFLEHVKNYDPNVEPDFNEEFYIYCAKKLIEEGKYTSYQIEPVTVI